MNVVGKITDFMNNVIDRMKTPAETLPAFLLTSVSIQRPGLSAYKIASEIISNNAAIGIETGKNPDGSPNVVNEYTYNVVKTIVDAIKNDAVVQLSVPVGSLKITAEGGNAGGPVQCIGTNVTPTILKGIIR